MLVINYNGNKPTTDYFKFAVQGNNNADVVRFELQKQQGNLDLSGGYTPYVKVYCEDDGFADKVDISNNMSVVENQLELVWTMQAKHTGHRQIQVSLSFENDQQEVVWQTQIVKMTISNGLDVAGQMENTYPDVLQELKMEKVYNLPSEYELKPISEVYAKVGEVAFMIYGTIFRIYKRDNTYDLRLFNQNGSGAHNLTATSTIESVFDGDPYQKILVDENSLGGLVEDILRQKALDIQLSDFHIEPLDQKHIELTFPKGIMIREIIFEAGREYHLSFTATSVVDLNNRETIDIESEGLGDLTYDDNNSIELYFENEIEIADPEDVYISFVSYSKIAGTMEI